MRNDYMNPTIVVILGIILILMIFFLIYAVVLTVDSFSLEKVRTDQVKCIDDHGNKFVDEMCDKKIYCSRWGIAGHERCKK